MFYETSKKFLRNFLENFQEQMSVIPLSHALGPSLPLRGVGSRRSRKSSLVSWLLHRQWKRLRRRGFLHRVYVCPQSQHAHTKHIQYDAHLPFLQQACASDGDDVKEDPCFSKKQEAWDPLPAAEDQAPQDLVLQPLQR
jgi:hypothetical protein